MMTGEVWMDGCHALNSIFGFIVKLREVALHYALIASHQHSDNIWLPPATKTVKQKVCNAEVAVQNM